MMNIKYAGNFEFGTLLKWLPVAGRACAMPVPETSVARRLSRGSVGRLCHVALKQSERTRPCYESVYTTPEYYKQKL